MRNRQLGIATGGYAVLVAAFWIAARHSAPRSSLGVVFPRAFASFSVLLAPLWFFTFGAAEPLRRCRSAVRVMFAGLLAVPYFVFAAGTSALQGRMALAMVAFPVLAAASLVFPKLPERMTCRDGVLLAVVTAAYFLRWLQPAWPTIALSSFSKLFLADVALFSFLVARRLDGMGYTLVPSRAAISTGVREWLFYFPAALLLGQATGFIHFHARVPDARTSIVTILVTFLLIALPEELFFRAILQNLLETRLGRMGALIGASALFGLSHFDHGSTFNWRYVLLATIAGIFYGRAWRAQKQIWASVLAHTLVDVVWSLWFR